MSVFLRLAVLCLLALAVGSTAAHTGLTAAPPVHLRANTTGFPERRLAPGQVQPVPQAKPVPVSQVNSQANGAQCASAPVTGGQYINKNTPRQLAVGCQTKDRKPLTWRLYGCGSPKRANLPFCKNFAAKPASPATVPGKK